MENKTLQETILSKYKAEIDNDNNDGWTKEHYRELYRKKLEEIEKENRKMLSSETGGQEPQKNQD